MNEHTLNKYFDNNATTRLFPEAKAAFVEALDAHWYNPSSLYSKSGEVKSLLEQARESLAEQLGIGDPQRIVFTSGATESNNIVLRHVAASKQTGRVLISEIEHPSVLEPASQLLDERCQNIPVDHDGILDLDSLEKHLREESPSLVSVMAANNETGVIQPFKEANQLSQKYQAAFHCDATQWLGKYAATELGSCDWLSGSAHKFGGPKGTGFLVIPEGLERLYGSSVGGPQERGIRAGTENYPAIAAMRVALTHADQLREGSDAIGRERDQFERRIVDAIPGTKICGASAPRLWNTSMLILPAHRNLKWLTRMSDLGFSLSTGSACSSGKGNPSHVMQAMGLDFGEMGRVLRFSAGWETNADDWSSLADALIEVYENLNSKASRRNRSKTISFTDIDSLSQ